MADRRGEEVLAVLHDFFAAVRRRDLPGFLGLFTGDDHLTVVENGDRYDWMGFQAFATAFFGELAEIAFEVEQSVVNDLGPGSAVVTGAFRGRGTTRSGDAFDFRHAFTFVLSNRAGGWRIAHVHESALAT
jgi:uncharacterized protein (TIGR02246 family)